MSKKPNDNTTNTYQYASTTPSVASLLNLPQVQEKKKPAAVSGLTGLAPAANNKPKLPIGLAPSAKASTPGTLKLKPKTPSVEIVEKVDELKIHSSVNEPIKPEDKVIEAKAVEAKVVGSSVLKTTTNTVKSANVTKKQSNNIKVTTNTKHVSVHSKQISPSPNTPTHTDTLNPAHWRLFVGNLGPEVSESLLLSTFQNSYPSTSGVLLVRDWKSQKSKGYAFVAFADGKEFLRALKEMNGKWIGNRQCIIKKSEHQPKL